MAGGQGDSLAQTCRWSDCRTGRFRPADEPSRGPLSAVADGDQPPRECRTCPCRKTTKRGSGMSCPIGERNKTIRMDPAYQKYPLDIDCSVLSWRDVADIGLQRTEHLARFPVIGSPSLRFWASGRPAPLYGEALLRRNQILRGVVDDVRREFAKIVHRLGLHTLDKIVDIGSGHAFIDLFFYRYFGCDIHLIDIERTTDRHHGYRQEGAGYASLRSARALLVSNGVPPPSIRVTNPTNEVPQDSGCDLIFSFLSCGFHYPLETYESFIDRALKSGGVFVFDLRKGTESPAFLGQFAECEVIDEGSKYQRIAARK